MHSSTAAAGGRFSSRMSSGQVAPGGSKPPAPAPAVSGFNLHGVHATLELEEAHVALQHTRGASRS